MNKLTSTMNIIIRTKNTKQTYAIDFLLKAATKPALSHPKLIGDQVVTALLPSHID